jgi:hypothetical protein
MPSLSFNVLHCNFVLFLLPRYLLSISEELLKPPRRQRGVARRILNIAMAKIGLDRARFVAVDRDFMNSDWTKRAVEAAPILLGSVAL